MESWDFSVSWAVKTLDSSAGYAGLSPAPGTKIPHAVWPKNFFKTWNHIPVLFVCWNNPSFEFSANPSQGHCWLCPPCWLCLSAALLFPNCPVCVCCLSPILECRVTRTRTFIFFIKCSPTTPWLLACDQRSVNKWGRNKWRPLST